MRFSTVIVVDDLITTNYGCEPVEDVATFIAVASVDDLVWMSASVVSNEEPCIASSSPVVTSTIDVVDELDNRGFIQSYDKQRSSEVGDFNHDYIGRSIHHDFSDTHTEDLMMH